MRLETGSAGVSIMLQPEDSVFVGMNADNWLPAQLGARLLGDRWALKVDFDLRDLYRGSDGAFYVVKGLQADAATFGDLELRRVGRVKDGP